MIAYQLVLDQQIENDPGNEKCGEHTRSDTEHKNDRKTLDLFGSYHVKDQSGDKRCDIRIEDSSKCA